MADPTLRIEAANSFREPDGGPGARLVRTKPRPKPSKQSSESIAALESDASDDDSGEHELDTVA